MTLVVLACLFGISSGVMKLVVLAYLFGISILFYISSGVISCDGYWATLPDNPLLTLPFSLGEVIEAL